MMESQERTPLHEQVAFIRMKPAIYNESDLKHVCE